MIFYAMTNDDLGEIHEYLEKASEIVAKYRPYGMKGMQYVMECKEYNLLVQMTLEAFSEMGRRYKYESRR